MDFPLVGPESWLGAPAPYLFMLVFKVLGFSLHMVPMHLWYAGLVTFLLIRWLGGDFGRRLSDRAVASMPVVIALGINLGIVPLLFTQAAYYSAFYPATVLMAWPWFAVIPLLMVAYYGVYAYVIGLQPGRAAPWRRAAGAASAVAFMTIGFIFANSLSLMARPDSWAGLWLDTQHAGAALGTALNTSDPTLVPRWLMMFGLALTTVGVFVAIDTTMPGGEGEPYRAWGRRLAVGVDLAGVLVFAAMGTWYIFGALRPELRAGLFSPPQVLLTVLTAVAPGLVLAFLWLSRARPRRAWVIAAAVAQLAVIGLNAVSRQWLQNAELAPFLDPSAIPVRLEWSPLVVFLVLFVGGLGVVAWMVAQAIRAGRTTAGAA